MRYEIADCVDDFVDSLERKGAEAMSRLDLIKMFSNEDGETFNKCSRAYEKGRSDATRWIPVRERLPKEYEQVLATLDLDDECVTTCVYYERNQLWERVIAWMPLPEPYEEKQK